MAAVALPVPSPAEAEENNLLPNGDSEFDVPFTELQANIQRSKKKFYIVIAIVCVVIIAAAILTYVSVVLFAFGGFDHQSDLRTEHPTCASSCCVYCGGDMLSVIQEFDFFNDSKYFVDMPMRMDPNKILDAWQQHIVRKGFTNDKEAVFKFVMKYFDVVGSDVTDCIPNDFNGDSIPNPLNDRILDHQLQGFALSIHKLWQYLCKSIDDDVYINPSRHSLLPLKYPQMMVAGGRFREVYYWDSYWIVQGLLVSNMSLSAKMTLSNLMNLTASYGHMLNGNRVYYSNRSQPPLLTFMMDLIYEFENKNDSFIAANMEYLEILKKEYFWWMNGQSVEVYKHNIKYTLNQYYIDSDQPRPEGFAGDTFVVSQLPNQSPLSIRHAYSSLRSAAESGWDFSSRFCLHLYCELDLSNVDTINVIPVELNAYLYHVESTLSKWFAVVNAQEDMEYFKVAARKRLDAMYNIFWDDDTKRWNDYDIRNDEQIAEEGVSSLSSYVPLWLLPYNRSMGVDVLTALNDSGLVHIGGVVTTNVEDGQQWDFPNAWPPLQWILVRMAQKYNETAIGQYIVHKVTQSYIDAAYIGYSKTQFMAEKYNGLHVGQTGDGGEYPAQLGFGWSNGVALSFLYDYGDFLVAPNVAFFD
eukprot:192510_1